MPGPGIVDTTTAQNVVTAIASAFQNYLNVQGVKNEADISAATLVKQGNGRVATVSILTAGSAVGAIYDTNSVSGTANKIYTIPNATGVVFLNMPVTSGIVVAPGTGQVVTISYA